MSKYFRCSAEGHSNDTRFDSWAELRKGVTGLAWSFTSEVKADTKAEAEKTFRTNKLFRRVARQNQASWKAVNVKVDRITKKAGIAS